MAIFAEIAYNPNFTTNSTRICKLVNSENRHEITKNRQNSFWSTNSERPECAFFKTTRLFEIRPNFGKKIPKYIHRAGRLQPLSNPAKVKIFLKNHKQFYTCVHVVPHFG